MSFISNICTVSSDAPTTRSDLGQGILIFYALGSWSAYVSVLQAAGAVMRAGKWTGVQFSTRELRCVIATRTHPSELAFRTAFLASLTPKVAID
jgi:hypothetical protein